MGRVFCSHVCPMGTMLDFSDKWLGRRQRVKENRGTYKRARKIKFVFLLVILSAAVAGFNLLGFGDPIVIFTRFAATIFHPVIMLLQDVALLVLRPIGAWLGWTEMAYLEMILPSFAGALLFVGLLILILVLSRLQPRFWCRHLCPLGAMLGWIGHWAPYRRRVSDKCNACNTCVRECPTGAIHDKGVATDRSECIVCLHCVKTCQEDAVEFTFTKKAGAVDLPGTATSRRMFLGGIAGGLAAGLSMRADMLHPSDSFLPLPERHGRLIRPPGALPEPEFMSRCVRCGECMRACLTNTLQPDWYRAGLEGLWAPHMSLRHAACEQTCNVCGHVCPTEAIRPLDLKPRLPHRGHPPAGSQGKAARQGGHRSDPPRPVPALVPEPPLPDLRRAVPLQRHRLRPRRRAQGTPAGGARLQVQRMRTVRGQVPGDRRVGHHRRPPGRGSSGRGLLRGRGQGHGPGIRGREGQAERSVQAGRRHHQDRSAAGDRGVKAKITSGDRRREACLAAGD
jgi:polyferredoxin